jgi:hypothetical protein
VEQRRRQCDRHTSNDGVSVGNVSFFAFRPRFHHHHARVTATSSAPR